VSWIKLDDRLLAHPKFVRAERLAGSTALHLWLGLLAYCKQRLTDGFVPADMLAAIDGPAPRWRARALDALVSVGLVHREPDGVRLHDYLAQNESRQAIETKQRERRLSVARPHGERGPSVARASGERVASAGLAKTKPKQSAGSPVPGKPPETETETETETVREGGKQPRGKPRQPKWRNVADAHPDWKPNGFHEALAARYRRDLRLEAAKFRDHDFAVPKTDPDRAFNNWLRRDPT
jgi:hypothetical protein